MVRLSLVLLCCLLVAAPVAAGTAADQQTSTLPPQKPAQPYGRSATKDQGAVKAHSAPLARKTPPQKGAPRHAGAKTNGLHARPWAFGPADTSRDPWQKALPSTSLQQRAVGKKSGSVDTARGINSALETARQTEKKRGGMNLHVANESSSWRESTPAQNDAPDENLPMESRHVVRAYADMAPSDDLSISVGPELILKNEQRERLVNNHQPESQLGLGMQFKLDF